jgi:DNA-binding HxlR family transcriptional regulator
MVLLDLLGRRWILRVLWELRAGELAFVALRRAAGGLSQSVLTLRLSELKQARLVEAVPNGGYRLTADGQSLVQEMSRLDRWADRWAAGQDHPCE